MGRETTQYFREKRNHLRVTLANAMEIRSLARSFQKKSALEENDNGRTFVRATLDFRSQLRNDNQVDQT